MSEYLLSLIGIVLLSAILTGVLPEGKTAGLIKSVMRMVCILTIISPILTFFRSGAMSTSIWKNSNAILSNEVIETDATFIHYYSEMRISETKKALEEELSKAFNVNCEAELVWTTEPESIGKNTTIEVIKITQIRIKMMEQLEEEVIREMWEYLTKNYCSEVLIE